MAVYPGYPSYLDAAAVELGLPHAAIADAQRQPAIHQLSSLLSQALEQTPRRDRDTLRRLTELRDALAIAALAAIRLVQLVDSGPPPVTVRRVDDEQAIQADGGCPPADRKPIRRH